MKNAVRLIFVISAFALFNASMAQATQREDEQDARRNQIRAERAAYEAERAKAGTARPWDRDANGFRPMDIKPTDVRPAVPAKIADTPSVVKQTATPE